MSSADSSPVTDQEQWGSVENLDVHVTYIMMSVRGGGDGGGRRVYLYTGWAQFAASENRGGEKSAGVFFITLFTQS